MAKVEGIAVKVLAQAANLLAIPEDVAGVGGQQAAEGAQQGGLAAAIVAAHMEEGAGLQAERQPGKEQTVTPLAGQIGDFKHGWRQASMDQSRGKGK